MGGSKPAESSRQKCRGPGEREHRGPRQWRLHQRPYPVMRWGAGPYARTPPPNLARSKGPGVRCGRYRTHPRGASHKSARQRQEGEPAQNPTRPQPAGAGRRLPPRISTSMWWHGNGEGNEPCQRQYDVTGPGLFSSEDGDGVVPGGRSSSRAREVVRERRGPSIPACGHVGPNDGEALARQTKRASRGFSSARPRSARTGPYVPHCRATPAPCIKAGVAFPHHQCRRPDGTGLSAQYIDATLRIRFPRCTR